MEEKKYSKKAVLSFVLIIICILYIFLFILIVSNPNTSRNTSSDFIAYLLFIPIICLISIILGIMGIIEIKKNKNLKGMWLAIPSMVLSILLGMIIVLVFMLAGQSALS